MLLQTYFLRQKKKFHCPLPPPPPAALIRKSPNSLQQYATIRQWISDLMEGGGRAEKSNFWGVTKWRDLGFVGFVCIQYCLVPWLGILRSFALYSFAQKERPWAIRSHNSLKRSNCEQITLITLYKRVARANRSLTKSDMSDFARFFEIEYSTLVLSLSKNKQFAK